MDAKTKQCDIIIPVFNQSGLTKTCLDSIRDATENPYTLILIDNASDDETREFLEDFKISNKDVQLVRNEKNVGWVKAINQGMAISKSPFICIMNNDTVIRTKDWLSKLIEIARMAPDIGLVNPRFDSKHNRFYEKPFVEIDFCRGYCILMKREAMEKIGALDESYGMGYYDDDDYSVRAIHAGFRCVRANGVLVEHKRDSTFLALFTDEKRNALHEENKARFYSKWGKRLKVVFIIIKNWPKKNVEDLAFMAARRQHITHLWYRTEQFSLPHINIRDRFFPKFLFRPFSRMALYLNKMKRKEKRYDIVFFDDPSFESFISRIDIPSYHIDIQNDKKVVEDILDAASKA